MPLGFFLNNTIEVSFIMITSRISRQAIFRGVLGLILITSFHFDAIASTSNEDVEARKKLVEKYREYKLIRARLETILFVGLRDEGPFPKLRYESREEVEKFVSAPCDIADEKSPKAIEALVDLLDFDISPHTNIEIRELISERGREAIPFLKRRISQKPLSFEQKIWERNAVIVELIKGISCGVKYFNVPEGLTKEEIVRSYLFSVQMDLEKHYREKGRYPKDLSQTYWTGPNRELIEKNMGQKLKYKGYWLTYFLCTLGEDGKFGTADDVKPPYNTDVFSFPDKLK
jgi:hypothetical protein